MSSSNSSSSVYSNASASIVYEIEDEHWESEKCDFEVDHEDSHIGENTDLEAYFDKLIADNVWLQDYNRRREENNERMAELELRCNFLHLLWLQFLIAYGIKCLVVCVEWFIIFPEVVYFCGHFRCSCGNCSIELLQNAKECCCCKEDEDCVTFLDKFSEDSTLQSEHEEELTCVINHPGFPAICLNRWSLELEADNFKTRDGHRYKQSDSKERYINHILQ